MLRDIFTHKWVIGGIALLIVLSVACVWWYHYDTAPDKREAADSAKLIREWEKSQKAGTDSEAEQAANQTPAESETPTAEKPINKRTTVTGNTEPTQAQNETESPAETAETADVRVSPHGFGPYPEVPEDYPSITVWERNPDNPNKTQELMSRVFVKLWTEGEKNFRGGLYENGKVYPWYYNTVYVRFRTYKNADGEIVRYAGTKMSGPHVDMSGIDDWFNPPPHIRVLDIKSSGIYPYQYLNLR